MKVLLNIAIVGMIGSQTRRAKHSSRYKTLASRAETMSLSRTASSSAVELCLMERNLTTWFVPHFVFRRQADHGKSPINTFRNRFNLAAPREPCFTSACAPSPMLFTKPQWLPVNMTLHSEATNGEAVGHAEERAEKKLCRAVLAIYQHKGKLI